MANTPKEMLEYIDSKFMGRTVGYQIAIYRAQPARLAAPVPIPRRCVDTVTPRVPAPAHHLLHLFL